MGSGNELYSESPAHEVTIEVPLLMSRFPITQAQWLTVMGENPSAFRDPLNPVDSISWELAEEFCRRLSDAYSRPVRLPSEAEWEYACRAGCQDEFFFGSWRPMADDTDVPREAQVALLDYAWFDANSRDRTHQVGLKKPNAWGLHDMLGNVWEWCADTWHGDYVGAPHDGHPWLADDEWQPRHCMRGGAWNMNAFRCRSSYRSFDHKHLGNDTFGLRVVVAA
jgi:formylglycine-generating enzyme required for sulfatase activity